MSVLEIDEGEHLFLAQPEALEQVLGWRLLDPTALAGAPRRRRIGRMPGGEDGLVAQDERLAEDGGEGAEAFRPRLLGRHPRRRARE